VAPLSTREYSLYRGAAALARGPALSGAGGKKANPGSIQIAATAKLGLGSGAAFVCSLTVWWCGRGRGQPSFAVTRLDRVTQ
ncbi:MAG: hypothetical protein Q8P46_15320, partial [Hyphomicrobiales bacterium]|nr:hypothetical protein [Hyphomicrobiales bacterium]